MLGSLGGSCGGGGGGGGGVGGRGIWSRVMARLRPGVVEARLAGPPGRAVITTSCEIGLAPVAAWGPPGRAQITTSCEIGLAPVAAWPILGPESRSRRGRPLAQLL